MEYKNEILIIADFMGLKYRTDCSTIYPDGYFHKPNTKEDAFPDLFFDDLKYHKSWDLLIPVYNKILKTFEDEKLKQLYKEPHADFVRAAFSTVFLKSDVTGEIQINSAFLKITDFLKWYFKYKIYA